jgi:hypothetical protein
MDKFSVKGCQIRWFKRTEMSKKERKLIKKGLEGMSETIEEAICCTKGEALKNHVEEIPLPLPPRGHSDVYLTVEYCDEAWHLILESSKECIAEIVCKGLPLIGTLEDKEVEVETI